MNIVRSYRRKRIPLTVTSGSVVLVHAAGACGAWIARRLGGRLLARKALR